MMDYDNTTNEITKYLTYLAKREDLIKNWEVHPGYSGVIITIHSINDDFVRNTITYNCTILAIRDRLEMMVHELKRMEKYNRMIKQYVTHDVKLTKEIFDGYFTLTTNRTAKERADNYIEKVIFNPPATIVFFKDGQKVVVKCQEGDDWDEEKALAMAIVKHDHGLPVFQKCLDKAERRYPDIDISTITEGIANAAQAILRMFGKSGTEDKSCKNCKFNQMEWSSKYEMDMPFCTSENSIINHYKSISEDNEDFYCKDFEPKEDTTPTSVHEND